MTRTMLGESPGCRSARGTGVAVPLELDDDVLATERARGTLTGVYLHIAFGQAFDRPALGADEMWMGGTMRQLSAPDLEPPDLVADLGAREEPRLGQIDEVAVDGRLVVSGVVQQLREFRVAHRPLGLLERPKHRYSGPRASQPCLANPLTVIVDTERLFCSPGHRPTLSAPRRRCNEVPDYKP